MGASLPYRFVDSLCSDLSNQPNTLSKDISEKNNLLDFARKQFTGLLESALKD